jgi:biopolymer transport protein ExbB
MVTSLWNHYLAGGWVMHPITLCSIVSVAAILAKMLEFRRVRLDGPAFLRSVREALLEGRMADALALCEVRRGPIPMTVRAGLLRHGRSREEIEAAMETAALHEIARLERSLGLLATIANLAPLIGFFGTVWGMIVSFDTIYELGLTNPALVAGGISQALYTTAWGLLVAFLALPFHNWFAAKAAEAARSVEVASGTLLETFSEMERLGRGA